MGDAEQPSRETVRIVEFRQILIGFQKHVLAHVEGIFAVRKQPQQVVEDALLPPGHEEVEGLHVSPPRFGDQVAIFNFPEDQIFGSVL